MAFAQEKMLSKDPPASGGATVYSNQNWMSDLKKNFSVEIVGTCSQRTKTAVDKNEDIEVSDEENKLCKNDFF